jgi:hypothetical protein
MAPVGQVAADYVDHFDGAELVDKTGDDDFVLIGHDVPLKSFPAPDSGHGQVLNLDVYRSGPEREKLNISIR